MVHRDTARSDMHMINIDDIWLTLPLNQPAFFGLAARVSGQAAQASFQLYPITFSNL